MAHLDSITRIFGDRVNLTSVAMFYINCESLVKDHLLSRVALCGAAGGWSPADTGRAVGYT